MGFATLTNAYLLVQSYVMDALETARTKNKPEAKTLKARAATMLESAGQASVEKRQSVALGDDVRLESNEIVGAGLEYEGMMLHMSIFLKEDNAAEEGKNLLNRASRRRHSILR
jgi:hypothetical protein